MMRRLIVACVALLVAGASFAAAPGVNVPGVPNTEGASVVLATGNTDTVDGFLSIMVDEYGSWGDFGGVGPPDSFNPAGPSGPLPVAFTSGSYFFVPARGQRELLTTSPDWRAVIGNPPPLITITSPNQARDLDGDGVDDAARSSFTMTGSGTDLSVDLTQRVSRLGRTSSQIEQIYTITNNEASSIDLQIVHNFDGDLFYDADFVSDEVGTTWNRDGGDTFVYMQEVGDGATAVRVSGTATTYYGGKLGIIPGAGPIPYGFGTDLQIWDNGGLPPNWANDIAGVGPNIDSDSGATPPGCDVGTGCDAFIGLSADLTIPAGGTRTFALKHVYGTPLEFNVTGNCPGTTTLVGSGGTPNGGVGIISSNSRGNDPLAAGPCEGTLSGLDNPSFFTIVPLDANGNFSLTRNAPSQVCGRFIKIVDAAADCRLSNTSRVPQ